jgi:hypothetical protein
MWPGMMPIINIPIYHRSWISTNYLIRRYEFIRTLVSDNQAMPGALKLMLLRSCKLTLAMLPHPMQKHLSLNWLNIFFRLPDNLTFDPALDDASGLNG